MLTNKTKAQLAESATEKAKNRTHNMADIEVSYDLGQRKGYQAGLDKAIEIVERRIKSWADTRDNSLLADERLIAASKVIELELLARIFMTEKDKK